MGYPGFLGPLLFILFINDIVNASKIAEFIMFADDTNLLFKHKELGLLFTINIELAKISQWFKIKYMFVVLCTKLDIIYFLH